MNENTNMTVTRNGQLDTDFYKAVRRAEQRRYVASLAKSAVKATLSLSFKIYTRAYDDINHSNYFEAYYGTPETKQERIARMRNEVGQFVSV